MRLHCPWELIFAQIAQNRYFQARGGPGALGRAGLCLSHGAVCRIVSPNSVMSNSDICCKSKLCIHPGFDRRRH